MRPSETAALTWADVNLEAGTVSINKSRNMGTESATKTANSEGSFRLMFASFPFSNYYRRGNLG
jgi:integrase